MVRHILVTGANKGIGLAIVVKCLQTYEDTHLIMACRSMERGQTAADDIIQSHDKKWEDRITVIEMDTSKDDSVDMASSKVKEQLNDNNNLLYGIVNNAGIAFGSLSDVLNVNTRGPKRVCDKFIPLLDPNNGRIVQMSSAAGPNCVAACTTDERKHFFTNPNITWDDIEKLMNDVEASNGDYESFGLGSSGGVAAIGTQYGLSKALLNGYTMYVAKKHPKLAINSCTPGMIATDAVSSAIPWWVPIPNFVVKFLMIKLLNAKSPEEGTVSTMHLLFSEDDDNLKGNGWYYGSDAKRSPLDKYRSPGSPEYDGP